MVGGGSPKRIAICLLVACASSLMAQSGTPGAGRALFTGAVRFKNGGPPCVGCHSVAGLNFPGGGAMGPDLTRAYSKLGPDGLSSALETLYFPAMTPLFAYRPLTPEERGNLAAFLQSINGREPPTETPAVAGIALGGLVILVGATGIAGRHRLRSVRKALLERAQAQARMRA